MKHFSKFIQENYVNEQVGRKAAIAAAVALAPGIAYAGDHTVKSGDTLSALAQKYGTTVEDLAKRNKIADPNKIQIGQTINFADKKKTTAPKATPKDPVTNTQRFAKDLVQYEGRRSHLYKDHKGNPTIGIGHLIGPDSKKRFEAAGLGDKYEGCVSGKCGLNDNEQDKLVQQDLTDVYVPRAEKLVHNFKRLNPEAQSAIVGSVFRGGLSGSPKTVDLMNQGKFKRAGIEFLDNDEYRESKKAGTGVYKRMDSYAKSFSNATTGNKHEKTFIEYFTEKETEQELLEKKSRKKKSAKKKSKRSIYGRGGYYHGGYSRDDDDDDDGDAGDGGDGGGGNRGL